MAYILNSRQGMNQGTPQQTSGADGMVDFPPQSGNFKIAVFADAGYAEVDQDDLAKSSDITLSPWGRIEGKMMIGSARRRTRMWTCMPAQMEMTVDPDEIRMQDRTLRPHGFRWEICGRANSAGHMVGLSACSAFQQIRIARATLANR